MSIMDTLGAISGRLDEYSPRPAFMVRVGDKQVTELNDRLISLSLTDNRGFEADSLELVLDDADGKLALPERGAKVTVALGWANEPLISKGTFTVDEIAHRGPPDQLTISARSADFRDTFNVKREYSWHNVTVGFVVSAIASRYGLKAGVTERLAKLELDHADQTNESDISFLTRMAEMVGAIATIKNGMLLFIVPGQAVSQSGKPLPAITITRSSGDSHSFRVADRDAYTGVTAYWLDLNFGKTKTTKVKNKRKTSTPAKKKEPASSSKEGNYLKGTEGNVYVMRSTFKTEQAAKRAAAAKWSTLQRGAAEFSMTLARGRADLYPELHARMSGFKTVIDNADWIITRCVHEISQSGFTTSLEFEVKITDWAADDNDD
ncbi:phage late control D family protein [Pectobacterium colocasium]|uniref:phage late control D family protein n=1 Tax=Pectobacterium colocasium TaxID=2878098 RepID=UPI001CD5C9C3|nr:phage late control D family protein [Pectobacterium colocasium]